MHRLHALTALVTDPTPAHLVVLAVVTLTAACIVWLIASTQVASIIAVGFAAEVFSGNWKYVPLPIPLDRVILVIGLGVLIMRGAGGISGRRVIVRPIHFLLLAVVAYTVGSAFWAGSLTGSHGFYALLDRLGAVPFLMYALAPHLFGTHKQRRTLLIVMVGLGVYLGVVAVLEGAGLGTLVFPRFINDPAIGITQDRARGPFLASDAMGLGLFDCAVFAGIALTEWRDRRARLCCWAVISMSAAGILFTLTRAVWVGAVLGCLAVAVVVPRLRRRIPAVTVLGVLALGAALILVPGLSAKFHGRVNTQASVWDRYNTNNAALRMVADHPVFGVGWQTFQDHSWQYLRTPATYPLTGETIEVHNVFLSHFAELGIIGGLLWALVLVTGVGGAIWRRGPPELQPWRLGLVAIVVMFAVVANLGPLSYAFPNLILWSMAGIVSVGRNSEPRPRPSLTPDAPKTEAPSWPDSSVRIPALSQ